MRTYKGREVGQRVEVAEEAGVFTIERIKRTLLGKVLVQVRRRPGPVTLWVDVARLEVW